MAYEHIIFVCIGTVFKRSKPPNNFFFLNGSYDKKCDSHDLIHPFHGYIRKDQRPFLKSLWKNDKGNHSIQFKLNALNLICFSSCICIYICKKSSDLQRIWCFKKYWNVLIPKFSYSTSNFFLSERSIFHNVV